MKILTLQVNTKQQVLFLPNEKIFNFNGMTTIVFSNKNSVGKTTLLRLLMYALGYPIPSTRGISFSKYETVLKICGANEEVFLLTRNGDYLDLKYNGVEKEYSLPSEQNEIHSLIYGTANNDILDNLLGTFYIDQEKGWTLLNRGKVIGNIHFSIEALLRGLSNRTDDNLVKRLSVIKEEIKKYKYMIDIAEYKAAINKQGETIYADSPLDDIENALEVLYCKRKPLEEELNRIKTVIRNNTSFEKYITSFRLRVKASGGEEIPVNKNTLVGYNDNVDLLIAKQQIVHEQMVTIDEQINNLIIQQKHDTTLFNVKSNIELFDAEISRIRVDAIAIKRIINRLEKEQNRLEDTIIESVKHDNPIVSKLHNLIIEYAKRLDLDDKYISMNEKSIFTKDLQSLSGAILHKIVFVFKISYIKLIQEQININLPIILDSPRGREVSKEIIEIMMKILKDDFDDHQIIIASIYDNYCFDNMQTIEIKDRLLPF